MIEVKDLYISFSGKPVLEGINLKFSPGENTIIVGKSGCGKSVLMKTIEGLIVPDKGKVLINGEDIFQLDKTDLNMIRKKLAMLFQGSALLDSFTVYQNLILPLIEHGQFSDDEMYGLASEMLQQVGLNDVFDLMPSQLSGGMKKRVALARAIIMKPEYVIFDEPTTGLDPEIAREIIKLIIKLQETYNLTSIIVTHDFECLKQIPDRVVMLADNKVIFDGSYKNFLKEKKKEIVSFIGIN